MHKLENHPIAEVFPLMCGQSFDDLVESIKSNGLRNPIVLWEGKILDGRNRYAACQAALVAPKFVTFDGDDPISFVVDENLHRRQLNASQKALAAAKVEALKHGQRLDYAKNNTELSRDNSVPMTLGQVAKRMDASRPTVSRARIVLEKACQEDIEAINNGKATVNGVFDRINETNRVKHSSNTGKREQNIQIWNDLKTGITALTNLPLPLDVVPIAKGYRTRNPCVEQKMHSAVEWLKEFIRAYEND